jgi:hypothetical protein
MQPGPSSASNAVPGLRHAWQRWALRVLVALALAGGVMLYLQPGFLMQLATGWMLC